MHYSRTVDERQLEHCLWPHLLRPPFRSIPGGFQNKVWPYFVLPYFSHVCGKVVWTSKTSQFMTTPYLNPTRHSSSVPLSLCCALELISSIWRRGPPGDAGEWSFSVWREVFRDISWYFAKSNHFPREKNARRGEHVQKVDHLSKGNQHLFSPNKVVIAF